MINNNDANSIYVLELTNDKYYVGMSQDPTQRIAKHLNGQGSSWTKKHQPTGRYRIINNGDNPYNLQEITESTVTYHLMQKFGYQNVRGSGWSTSNDLPIPPQPPSNYCPL
jgi:hypothetical protein